MSNRASHFKNEERYKDYQTATKGLDQEVAWQALTGDSGRRGQSFGNSDRARYNALMKAKSQKVKSQEEKQPQIHEDKQAGNHEYKPDNKGNPIDNTQTGNNDAVPSNDQIKDTNTKNSQQQSVRQDNDINNNVSGNDNTIINNQDNSVRQYGGDNRSFVYKAGKNSNPYESTPVSAATMGGFYDVDDSPAAQAKFQSMYKDFNKDNSKRFAGQALQAVSTFSKNFDPREYTAESMENAINRGTQYSFDRADRQTGHVFGDIWNDNYITEEWKMPSAPAPIESNAEGIADKAKQDIEDI